MILHFSQPFARGSITVLCVQSNSYNLIITATDGGNPPQSTNASVTLTNSATQQPLPVWQQILGIAVDDYNDTVITEDAALYSMLSVSQYLTATVSQGTTNYFLSGSDGSPATLNGDGAFTVQASTSSVNVMQIVVGHSLDASVTDTYVLRCRAFVSCLSFIQLFVFTNTLKFFRVCSSSQLYREFIALQLVSVVE
jgi:hypothetical protein